MQSGKIDRLFFSVCKFGIPETNISDRAANLNQNVVGSLCWFFSAKKRASVSCKPDTDGAAGRFHTSFDRFMKDPFQSILGQ